MSETTSMDAARAGVGVVLVHGACHGSWCWEDVVGPVQAAGFAVHAVDLPLTTLSADAETVRSAVRAMKDSGKSVLLAGHSYGGSVITAAGHEADALMYCAAVVPDSGQTPGAESEVLTTPELAAAIVVDGLGQTFSMDPDLVVAAFYGRCSPDQVDAAVSRLRPMHLACFGEVIPEAAWRTVPASYVVCEDDHAVAPAYQRQRAEALGDFVTLQSDHSAFYSATDGLVDRIVAVSNALTSKGVR